MGRGAELGEMYHPVCNMLQLVSVDTFLTDVHKPSDMEPQLVRFMGHPQEISPKAWFWLFMGWLLPTRFKYAILQIILYFSDVWDSTEPPFDRHDWVVRRPRSSEEVQYVIDYYSAPPTPDGTPVFALNVCPALDSMESMCEQLSVGMGDIWETMRERGWGKSSS